MLKEVAPGTSRMTFLFNPKTAPYANAGYYQASFDAAARSLAITLTAAPVNSPSEIESAVGALRYDHGDGLIVIPDSFNIVHRERIIGLAAQRRVPAIYPYSFAVREGGLISYGVDQIDPFRGAASDVDRLLKGEKAADIPVQAPTKFEIVINLKAAKALGLTISRDFLLIADEVIE
jgi:putative tryptophan/tyrosine transport system substrate-binding protein